MEIKECISKNIQMLRKANKLTQLELAEKINYSDKAISRWESGEVTPDIETLSKLAKIFSIPLNSLLEEGLDMSKAEKEIKQKQINKLIITLLIISFIWTLATIVYIYSMIVDGKYYWQIFIYAFPSTFFVSILFSCIWGKKNHMHKFTSCFVWTLLLSIYIETLSYNVWPIFILGVPLQVVIILWSKLHS